MALGTNIEGEEDASSGALTLPAPPRLKLQVRLPLQDKVFRASMRACAVLTFAIIAVIVATLVSRSTKAIDVVGVGKFLTTQQWSQEGGIFGIGSLAFNTLMIALVAIVIAVPVSVCTALFITEYAPRAVRATFTSLIDLLAALPSVIFGIWGLFYLTPRVRPLSRWLSQHLAFIPIFKVESRSLAGSTFIAGIVVALMVTPIVTAIVRQVFSQAPAGQREAALALGGSKWGVIRTVVIPHGKRGIVGGAILGFGRALGETVAVVIVISAVLVRNVHILQSGANSISAFIAEEWGESTPLALSGLMAAGLCLFLFTLVVNALASVIVQRSSSAAGQVKP